MNRIAVVRSGKTNPCYEWAVTAGTRWPELESSLQRRAFVHAFAMIGVVALVIALPHIAAPALQLAALAGVGALVGLVGGGILDVWFYLRPTEILFEHHGKEPRIIVGLVPQAAYVVLGVCLVVVAAGLSWQFGDEQIPLSRQDRGPYVPFSLVAMGFAGFFLWASVAAFSGWRPTLAVTARGVATRGTGAPFSVGWSAITAVREVNHPGSFFAYKKQRRENYIALDTIHDVTLRIEAHHVKPSAYDVFLLIRALHDEPALRTRVRRAASVDELLGPADDEAVQQTSDELPFSSSRGRHALVAAVVVGLVVVPFAIVRAGNTPLIAESRTDAANPGERPEQLSSSGGFDDVLRQPRYEVAATCRELRAIDPLLTQLAAGLRTVAKDGSATSTADVPPPQRILNAAGVMASYAGAQLHGEAAERWRRLGGTLEVAAETAWYSERSNADAQFRWSFLAQQVPDLMPAARQALEAIENECS